MSVVNAFAFSNTPAAADSQYAGSLTSYKPATATGAPQSANAAPLAFGKLFVDRLFYRVAESDAGGEGLLPPGPLPDPVQAGTVTFLDIAIPAKWQPLYPANVGFAYIQSEYFGEKTVLAFQTNIEGTGTFPTNAYTGSVTIPSWPSGVTGTQGITAGVTALTLTTAGITFPPASVVVSPTNTSALAVFYPVLIDAIPLDGAYSMLYAGPLNQTRTWVQLN